MKINSLIELVDFLKKFKIKLTLKNKKTYITSFTHNSYSNENKLDYNYQRLEFLGDAILQKEVSLFLYNKYPKANEGVITNYRSIIVRKDTLASFANSIKLSSLIRLGKGEIKTKGYKKNGILADIFESFLAAIYIDKGDKFTSKFILKYLISFVYKNNFLTSVIDYKTKLQEYMQLSYKLLPKYKVIEFQKKENSLEDVNQYLYKVEVYVDSICYGKGIGRSIKDAEQAAAKDTLNKLSNN